MKYILALLAVVLIIAGCSAQEQQPTPVVPQEQETQVEETPVQETPVVEEQPPAETPKEITLTDEQKAAAESAMRDADRVIVHPSFKRLSAGDEQIFAVGVVNRESADNIYRMNIRLKSAKDKYQSSLFEDKTLANSWFQENTFTTFNLRNNERVFLPLKITAQDLTDDTTPKPGTYTFVVEVEHGEGSSSFDTYATREFSVIVE